MTESLMPHRRSRDARHAQRKRNAGRAFWMLVRPPVSMRRFLGDLFHEIINDTVLDSAAVLAYFSMLAIFPLAILMLSLLPYLPIPNLEAAILAFMRQAMPPQAADLLTSTVTNIVSERRGGLLSFGIFGTLWAASTGLQTMMEQLHATQNGADPRPYWKLRAIALGLVFAEGVLVIGAFTLVIVGDWLLERLSLLMGADAVFLWVFAPLRWATIFAMILLALSLLYYFGPNIQQRYRVITPGGLLATVLFILASLLFRAYVAHFGSYEATYGSLGAAIVLLLWLYVGGVVILVGAEVNGLLERYAQTNGVEKTNA
jgi:membrane protein